MSLWIVMTMWGLVATSDGPLEIGFDACERAAAANRAEINAIFLDGEPMRFDGRAYGRDDINVFCVYQPHRPRRSIYLGTPPMANEQIDRSDKLATTHR